MDVNTMKPRQNTEKQVECWDDDGDLGGFDDLQFRSASTATSVTNSSQVPNHRDSISSRMSARSEIESSHGDDDWQVMLPDDEQTATKDAIASAKSKGIPIPDDVPKSALLGGTIRRLGGKKIKKAMGDDWSDDLELPGLAGELKLAKTDANYFPANLRQISAAFMQKSPAKKEAASQEESKQALQKSMAPTSRAPPINLNNFRDNEEDGFFSDMSTIKVSKSGPATNLDTFTPKMSKVKPERDDFESELELPKDGFLKLSAKKDQPRTPHQDDEVDLEWAEGSLGTRRAGTQRDGRSNRSSSISALSPSVSSCLTAESEDEGLDGLVLPNGPLKFEQALQKRKENASPDPGNYSGEHHAAKRAAAKEDFFSGLEIGDGDVFDSGKLTLNRNIKHKLQRPTSPTRPKTAAALTFTNKTHVITRIPRLHQTHERPRSTLEPVSESGASVSRFHRPDSRVSGGHSAQSSISSIPTPTTPSTPSTPSRRGLYNQASTDALRREPVATTGAQLLKAKRSMPVMRNVQSPSKSNHFNRPPSRHESASRLNIPPRPKTPTDRSESSLSNARRPPVPFLPAGASQSQSHHVNIKTSRHFRRNDSEGSNEGGLQRPMSRLSIIRPETPGHLQTSRKDVASAELMAAAKKSITRPVKRRNYGDGTELDNFDDLHVSTSNESKYVKQPTAKGAPKALRHKLGQSFLNPSTSSLASTVVSRADTVTPVPSTPRSPTKPDLLPRFARDTAASRNARESRQASSSIMPRERESGPLASLTTNWKANIARALPSPITLRKRPSKPAQTKPYLIKPLGRGVHEPRSVKGMFYNPVTLQWEGNENATSGFELPAPVAPPSPRSPKPAPALITNVGSSTGFQVVGGMVFDPHRMCWLKMAPSQPQNPASSSLRGGVGTLQLDEEEDVFAGLEDLKEENESRFSSNHGGSGAPNSRKTSGTDPQEKDVDAGGGGESSDEWVVNEEFDVGPEFVKRQRHEEERWRRKVEKWLRPLPLSDTSSASATVGTQRQREAWRWAIRDIAS